MYCRLLFVAVSMLECVFCGKLVLAADESIGCEIGGSVVAYHELALHYLVVASTQVGTRELALSRAQIDAMKLLRAEFSKDLDDAAQRWALVPGAHDDPKGLETVVYNTLMTDYYPKMIRILSEKQFIRLKQVVVQHEMKDLLETMFMVDDLASVVASNEGEVANEDDSALAAVCLARLFGIGLHEAAVMCPDFEKARRQCDEIKRDARQDDGWKLNRIHAITDSVWNELITKHCSLAQRSEIGKKCGTDVPFTELSNECEMKSIRVSIGGRDGERSFHISIMMR